MASVQFRGSEENGMVAVSNLVSKSSLEARILVGDNLGSVYVVEYNEGKLECSSARAAEGSIQSIHLTSIGEVEKVAVGANNSIFLEDFRSVEDLKLRIPLSKRVLPVTCCSTDDENKVLVVASQEAGLQVFDLLNEAVLSATLFTNGIGIKCVSVGHKYSVYAVDFSGNLLIFQLNVVSGKFAGGDLVFEAKSVVETSTIRNPALGFQMDVCSGCNVGIIPSKLGTVLCCYQHTPSAEWKEHHLNHSSAVTGSRGEVCLARFSTNWKMLATSDSDGSVAVWNVINVTLEPSFTVARVVKPTEFGVPLALRWWKDSNLFIVSSNTCYVVSGLNQPETVAENAGAGQTQASRSRLSRKEAKADVDDNEDDDFLLVTTDNVGDIKKAVMTSAVHESDVESEADSVVQEEVGAEEQLKGQLHFHPAVQISSTKYDEKSRRYLVWNSVGNITTRVEDHSNRIEIRFSNKSRKNKQEVFNDNWGFIMAALSHEGAVFAANCTNEKDNSVDSTIHYHAFSHGGDRLHGANESFTFSLPANEAAVSLAIGCGWIAVGTSRQFLRIFSMAGTQLAVHCLKGPLVCLSGYESLLAVIVCSQPAFGGNNFVTLDLFDIIPNESVCCRMLTSIPVPLSGGSFLEWAGFSVDSMMFFVSDSNGVFYMLTAAGSSGNWVWVPVLEIEKIRRSVGHSYWPVTVLENKLAYVLLSGENKPAIFPEPMIATQPFKIPVCESKDSSLTDRHQQLILQTNRSCHNQFLLWEQQSLGRNHAGGSAEQLQKQSEQIETEYDKVVLKLFQDSCRTHHNALSLDLALKLRSETALEAAITVANHFGKGIVAQRVEEIINFRRMLLDVPANSAPPIANVSPIQDNLVLPSTSSVTTGMGMEMKPSIVNPFAKTGNGKRMSEINVEELRSPNKKSLLSRQTSISERARNSNSTGKLML